MNDAMESARGRWSPPVHPLMHGAAPEWASSWGEDRFGVFVGIEVKGVEQRMRWIPPGKFRMGSPKGEAGRWEQYESEPYEIDMSEGFWLADSPCTQEFWQAVTGENPSAFKSPDRPVERVSFDDVLGMLERLNDLISGLDAILPSEVRWEYACRAGTTTATYLGDPDIVGECNAPLLDEIGWYAGNCAFEFDLDNGQEGFSWWNERQYPGKGGTHPVGLKRPNPWGLYDMLGQLWEWCADEWSTVPSGIVHVRPEHGAIPLRVVRGGAWSYPARSLRAAIRARVHPSHCDAFMGFRLARDQVSRPS